MREKMMKKTEKALAIVLAFAMIIGIVLLNPSLDGLAAGEYKIELSGSTGIVVNGTGDSATVSYQNGTATITGSGLTENNGVLTSDSRFGINLTPVDGYEGSIMVYGQTANDLSGVAASDGPVVVEISFTQQGGNNPGPGTRTYTANFNGASYTVGDATVTATVAGVTDYSNVTLEEDTTITFTNFDPATMKVVVGVSGEDWTTELTVDNEGKTSLARRRANPDGTLGGIPDGTLSISVEGSGNNAVAGIDLDFDVKFAGSNIVLTMEEKEIVGESDEFDLDEYTFTGTVNVPATNDPNLKNLMVFRPRYGDYPLKEVTINGITYKADSESVHVDGDTWYVEVPGDRAYTINGVADVDAVVPRTIIWANPDYVPTDAEDAEWVSQFTVKNGKAKVIAVYDENGNKLNPKDYIGENSDDYGLTKGFGWVQVYAGYKVVFEFCPDYGYQLTSITLNEQPMAASGTMNQYTVEVPNANLHFAATFTKTEDIVKANSKNVDSGSIYLGSALPGGSAQLTVNDVELPADKVAGFERAAGDYTIANYLDIDLYNVYYKGKNDANDVWSNKIDELDKEATIKIKLAEGVNVEDIVIIHNIHDGETFEVIQIDSYDPDTRIVTFKTKSFSNYAIATKTKATDTTTTPATVTTTPAATTTTTTTNNTSPKTGDDMMMFVALLAMSVMGLGIMTKSELKKKFK